MARRTRSLPCLLLLATTLLSDSAAMGLEPARQVAQRLDQRQTFEGGWAMALPGATCPSDTPVKCSTSIANAACCPKGTTCMGLSAMYCCPSSTDCGNVVQEFPRCADSSWTLYEYRITQSQYFCCPPGQFGVLPIENYGGLCQPDGANVAASRIATRADGVTQAQTTVTSASQTTRTVTSVSTGTDGVAVTVTKVSTDQVTVSKTTSITKTSAGSDTTAAPAGGGSSPGSSNSLGPGPIAGIVIGALGVLALFLLAFLLWRRMNSRNTNNGGQAGYTGSAPDYSSVPPIPQDMQQYPIVVKGPTVAPAVYSDTASPGYPSPNTGTLSPQYSGYGTPPVEVPVGTPLEGRVEMGTGK